MSPVPLFCHSPPPGATLESQKNELIIYCLVYPPLGGVLLASWGGVGQKRANFGLLGGVGKKGLILAILGYPPLARGYTQKPGLLTTWGTPPLARPPRQPHGTPPRQPQVPPPWPGVPPR